MNIETTASIAEKIKSLDELAAILEGLKSEGKRIVHTHGVFDLVHPGHIRHLERASQEGDVLVVTLTADAFVDRGPGRPVFNQRLRAETLGALRSVDFVAITDSRGAGEPIRTLRPDVFARGKDAYESGNGYRVDEAEEAIVISIGGRMCYTEDVAFSSTQLLNTYFDVFPPETLAYLNDFRQRYSADDVISRLRDLRKLKVLVVGDTIVDEYHLCQPYGMASKSSAVAAQFLKAESYAGGALAVANHLAGFCDEVALVTCLGEQDSKEEFIRGALKPNITPTFLFRPDAPTMVKRRYVKDYLATKLFEIAFFNDQLLPEYVERMFRSHILDVAADYDLVVSADFGHGLFGPSTVNAIANKSRFLAVNVQLNSVNRGYNIVTKYPCADYVCIDEQEARMATREQYAPLEGIVENISGRLGAGLMTVTQGHKGAMTYQKSSGFAYAPVLSRDVVDPIGAGDAFLSVTSACACAGYEPELIGFVGNAVGALAVRILGNKESVEPEPLFRFINTLLK